MKLYSIIITLILIGLALVAGFFGWMIYDERMKMVAEFPDASGTPAQYQLWYGNYGDLELRTTQSNPSVPSLLIYDYYGSTEVKTFAWKSDDELEIVTFGDTVIEFKIGRIEIHRIR